MKKILVLMLGIGISLLWSTYAQQDPNTSNLGDLLIRFCNDPDVAKEWWSKELKISATPWSGTDLCIYLVNGGPTDVEVQLWFVDGAITNDAEQKKACQPEASTTQFWQYVKSEWTGFTIPARSTIETHATLTFPEDTAGMVYWCATLKIAWNPETEWAFQVVSRRANFIDVSVKWLLRSSLKIVNQEIPAWWMVHNKDPRFYIISNPATKEFFWKIVLKNDWNVAQYVSLQPTAKRWGKTTNHETISKKILPQQQSEFLIPLTDKPRWEWSLHLSASITSNPVLEDNSDLDTGAINMEAKQELVITSALFIPWTLIFSCLGALLLALILSGTNKAKKNKKKKEHEEE